MEITRKQLVVLDYIKRFIMEHGYSPTVREIGEGLSLKSPATVHDHLKNLEKLGIISMNPTKSRTIELLVENEYVVNDLNTYKLPIVDTEFNGDFFREFIELPKFMLYEYDPKDIMVYMKSDKEIYLISKTSTLDNERLYLNNHTLVLSKYSEGKLLGTVVGKFIAY